MEKNNCEHCRWHDDFSWACSNGDSPYCADFTDNKQSCPAFEAREEAAE